MRGSQPPRGGPGPCRWGVGAERLLSACGAGETIKEAAAEGEGTPPEAPRGAEGEGKKGEPRLSRPVAAGTGGHPPPAASLPPPSLPRSLTRARRAQPPAPPSLPPALAPVKLSPASLRPAPPWLSAAAAGPARLPRPRPALTWVLPPPPGGSGEGARCARRGGDVLALPGKALLREVSGARTAGELRKERVFSPQCRITCVVTARLKGVSQ